MSTLTGDIIITGNQGHDGTNGDSHTKPAESGDHGRNASCDWDSVCRPKSSEGTDGADGSNGGDATNAGDGSNCPSATIKINDLVGTIVIAAAAGDGGNGGNGGKGRMVETEATGGNLRVALLARTVPAAMEAMPETVETAEMEEMQAMGAMGIPLP